MTSETGAVRWSHLSGSASDRRRARGATGLRSQSFRTALEESLGLFIVGGVCCVLGAYYISTGERWGGSRLPMWELFVALGIVGLVGGFLSMAAEEDTDTIVPRTTGRPIPHVVLDEPELPDPPIALPPRRPAVDRFDLEAGNDAPLSPGDETPPPASVPPWDLDVATSVADALAELDGVERSLSEGPRVRVNASPDPARSSSGAVRSSPQSGGDRLAGPRGVTSLGHDLPGISEVAPDGTPGCGGCGQPLLGAGYSDCPGCGSRLCPACWEGLEPPPCTGCAVLDRPP